jgi:hypothetical protein
MLMDEYAVFVHTARNTLDVAMWLERHGVPATIEYPSERGTFWTERGVLLVTHHKLPASRYLDDRAVRFTSWPRALRDLLPGDADQTRRERVEQALREVWPDLDGLVVAHLAVLVEATVESLGRGTGDGG